MHILNQMTITANRDELLIKLRENRDEHGQIVAEAREGYMKRAHEALKKRLSQLGEGKIVSLHFSLQPPQDHTRVYDTAIRMLELHTEETITLTAQQVRHLEMDEWDWMDSFLETASRYSGLANDKMTAKNS